MEKFIKQSILKRVEDEKKSVELVQHFPSFIFKNAELIDTEMILEGVESRLGIEKNGIIDSDISNIAETLLGQRMGKVKGNRLTIDEKFIDGDYVKDIIFENIEVVDINIISVKKYLSHVLNLLGEVSRVRSYFQINIVDFDDIKLLLDKMEAYGKDYWNIRALSISLKDFLSVKESSIIKEIPNIRLKKIFKTDEIVELKTTMILKEQVEDAELYKDFIYNNLKCSLLITESCLIDNERIKFKTIELVTEGTYMLENPLLKVDLFFIRKDIMNISNLKTSLNVMLKDDTSYRLGRRNQSLYIFSRDRKDGSCDSYEKPGIKIIKISSKDDILYILTSKLY